jgi:hypothetical protein
VLDIVKQGVEESQSPLSVNTRTPIYAQVLKPVAPKSILNEHHEAALSRFTRDPILKT